MKALVELKRSFLKDLEITRGRSKKTIENYDRYLELFLALTKTRSVSHLTEERVRSFRECLQRQSVTKDGARSRCMKQRTQNYHLSALRMFLRFLRTMGYDVPSPHVVILHTLHPTLPERLSPEEIECLSSQPRPKTLEDKRDVALVKVLLETGLRTAQLCALSLAQVNFRSGEITIVDEKNQRSIFHLSRPTLRALSLYVEARDDASEALFVRYGRKMHDGTDRRIHPRAVQRLIKKQALHTGVTLAATPQMVRGSVVSSTLQELSSLDGELS